MSTDPKQEFAKTADNTRKAGKELASIDEEEVVEPAAPALERRNNVYIVNKKLDSPLIKGRYFEKDNKHVRINWKVEAGRRVTNRLDTHRWNSSMLDGTGPIYQGDTFEWGAILPNSYNARAMALRKAAWLRICVVDEDPDIKEVANPIIPVVWNEDMKSATFFYINANVIYDEHLKESKLNEEQRARSKIDAEDAIAMIYTGRTDKRGVPITKSPYLVIRNGLKEKDCPNIKAIKDVVRQRRKDVTDPDHNPYFDKDHWINPDPSECAYAVIEYCCEEDSNLCSWHFNKTGNQKVALIRLTEEIDMTTESGLDYAMYAVDKFGPCCPIFLWVSIPCTGGSTFQKINRWWNPAHKERMRKHDELFKALHKNMTYVAKSVESYNGKMAFEWPMNNDWWTRSEIEEMIQDFELKTARVDGCKVGVRSPSGKLHYKPWRIETNCNELRSELSKNRCNHSSKDHEPICGKRTKRTGEYPMELCTIIHSAIRKWCGKEAIEIENFIKIANYDEADVKNDDSPPTEDVASVTETASLFDIEKSWIFDSGCGRDLVTAKLIEPYQSSFTRLSTVSMQTANGQVSSAKGLKAAEEIGQVRLNAELRPLPSTPAVISMGKRCMEDGYAFLWLPGKTPCMINPAGNIMPLDVRARIPYIDEDGLWKLYQTPTVVQEMTGVSVDKPSF